MTRRYLPLLLIGVALGLVVKASLPDISRYLKMRAM